MKNGVDGVRVGSLPRRYVCVVSCVVLGILAAGPAGAEIWDSVSTPDADQYGGLGDDAYDASVTVSEAFSGSGDEPTQGGSSAGSSAGSPSGSSNASVETSPVGEGFAGSAEKSRHAAAGITELPDTGGPAIPWLGVALVAGGSVVAFLASRRGGERSR